MIGIGFREPALSAGGQGAVSRKRRRLASAGLDFVDMVDVVDVVDVVGVWLLGQSFISGSFWQRFFSGVAISVASVEIEDEDGTVFAADLDRLAGVGALVEEVETRLRIVVGNPFADGLPGGGDGLEGLDVEGRVGWRREVDDSFPESVESEEELDFAGADDGADALHGGLAARALERGGAPDAEDEIAPERAHGAGAWRGRMARAHGAGGGFGRWRDDRRLGWGWFFGVGVLRWWAARHPTAFVRVEAVIANGLLAARRER